MAAWGYEFYLRALKVSLTSERNPLYIPPKGSSFNIFCCTIVHIYFTMMLPLLR